MSVEGGKTDNIRSTVGDLSLHVREITRNAEEVMWSI
jgi:hypothetical protein